MNRLEDFIRKNPSQYKSLVIEATDVTELEVRRARMTLALEEGLITGGGREADSLKLFFRRWRKALADYLQVSERNIPQQFFGPGKIPTSFLEELKTVVEATPPAVADELRAQIRQIVAEELRKHNSNKGE